jgi:hypothetical protein
LVRAFAVSAVAAVDAAEVVAGSRVEFPKAVRAGEQQGDFEEKSATKVDAHWECARHA